MIPDFEENGYLPQGRHIATWQQIEDRFNFSESRRDKLKGLKEMLNALKSCGCKKVYLDGSFTSRERSPNDFDLCYDKEGIDFKYMQEKYPILLDRAYIQKKKFKGECYKSDAMAKEGMTILQLFQTIKYTDEPKGIIEINLNEL